MLIELIDWGLNPDFITPGFLASQGFSATIPWRFIRKVYKTDSCWLWTRYTNRGGYGVIGCRSGNNILAHVLSWILHFGPIPERKCVLHNCPDGDNPACVHPDHLWLGSRAENVTDMWRK